MSFSIYHDWSEYKESMINHGRNVIEEACTHYATPRQKKEGDTNMRYQNYCDKCGYSEDSGYPMMNFKYPLELDSFDDEKILEVLKRTNCTVIEDEDTGEWFLSLTGGGMDLSQDIALAYHILEKWIPFDLCVSVCTQPGLSIGGKDWGVLKAAMQESLERMKGQAERALERWQ
jgi:hypothetical protein